MQALIASFLAKANALSGLNSVDSKIATVNGTGVSAAAAVRRILPYMIGKRQQAELLLEFTALKGTRGRRRSDATVARMAEICALFRVLNARRPRHAERLSEGAPRIAIVGSLPPRMMR